MIIESRVYQCPHCESTNLSRNGRSKTGKQKYHCKECGAYGTLDPTVAYTPERRAEILKAYHERSSLRGLERTFGVPAKRSPIGYAKKIANCQICHRSTLRNQATFWSWTSFGPLSGQKKQTLGLDSTLSAHSPDCCLLYRWAYRRRLLALVVLDSPLLPSLCHLQ